MTDKIKIRNQRYDKIFAVVGFTATALGFFVLLVLFADVLMDGAPRLSWQFMTSFPSRRAAAAGILSAWVGTLWIMVITFLTAFPLGVASAIYLEEYSKKSWFYDVIEITISNLAGVPSIIYGLLGLGLFVRTMMLDRSLLAGGFTLGLLVLPIIILASREAFRAVPPSIREASLALGASKWQTVSRQVLPAAMPGVMTGTILAMSRAIGETAPLVTMGALTYIAFLPRTPMDMFTVLPIQIFNWVSRPQKDFAINAAAGIVVLLIISVTMNLVAILIRQHYRKKIRW